MTKFWRHTCGHTSLRDPWGIGEEALDMACQSCLNARIGERIAFARYGKPPSSGVSRNARDNTTEAGVSVYEIVEGSIRTVGWSFGITDRPLYVGRGVIVGWGSDGEPLVRIECIRKARKAEITH